MKKLKNALFFILISSFLLAGCSSKKNNSDSTFLDPDDIPQKFFVHIPTAEQEADYVLYLINNIRHFDTVYRNNENALSLPDVPIINSLKTKVREGNALTENDFNEVKALFINEIYDENNYNRFLTEMEKNAKIANMMIPVFESYKQKWGFYIPDKYIIHFSLYGTDGMIAIPLAITDGVMSIKIPNNGEFQFVLGYILHEATHIGISENIIQRYNVPYWANERIVDMFITRHFLHVLASNYLMDLKGDAKIDVIFQARDVFDHLPTRVGDFMENARVAILAEAVNMAESSATIHLPTELEGAWFYKWNPNYMIVFKGNGFCEIHPSSLYIEFLPVTESNRGNFSIVNGKITNTNVDGITWEIIYRIGGNEFEFVKDGNTDFSNSLIYFKR